MMKTRRDVKGIWIPIEIWESKKLTLFEKFLLAEIDSLDRGDGCYQSNESFAEFGGTSKGHVANSITKLRKKGLLKTIKFDGRKRYLRTVFSRFRVNRDINPGLSEKVRLISSTMRSDNTVEGRSRTSSPSFPSTPCFFPSDGECSKFLLKAVTTLEDFVRTSRRMNKKRHNRKKWYDDMRLLLHDLDGDKARLKRVLKGYVTNQHDEWAPKVESADGFRQKFTRIESWLDQVDPPSPKEEYQVIIEGIDEM